MIDASSCPPSGGATNKPQRVIVLAGPNILPDGSRQRGSEYRAGVIQALDLAVGLVRLGFDAGVIARLADTARQQPEQEPFCLEWVFTLAMNKPCDEMRKG